MLLHNDPNARSLNQEGETENVNAPIFSEENENPIEREESLENLTEADQDENQDETTED